MKHILLMFIAVGVGLLGSVLYDYTTATRIEERPLPKVGECFEDYYPKMKELSYQYKKVIKIDPESEFDTIHYVYNMPHSEGFEHGQWYHLPPLTSESKSWFYGTGSKLKTVNKIECPW